MKRRGFTLVEILVALLLLGTLTTVCLQFFVGVNGQWREQVAQLAAAEEAANVMERLAAVAWDDLPTQSGDKYSLSTQARKQLPEGRVEVKVSGTLRVPPVNGTRSVPDTEARRIIAIVLWRPVPDEPERKAQIVAWRYKQP